jgi:hypothetical protein
MHPAVASIRPTTLSPHEDIMLRFEPFNSLTKIIEAKGQNVDERAFAAF